MLLDGHQGLVGIAGHHDFEAFPVEIVPQDFGLCLFVFNNQGFFFHNPFYFFLQSPLG